MVHILCTTPPFPPSPPPRSVTMKIIFLAIATPSLKPHTTFFLSSWCFFLLRTTLPLYLLCIANRPDIAFFGKPSPTKRNLAEIRKRRLRSDGNTSDGVADFACIATIDFSCVPNKTFVLLGPQQEFFNHLKIKNSFCKANDCGLNMGKKFRPGDNDHMILAENRLPKTSDTGTSPNLQKESVRPLLQICHNFFRIWNVFATNLVAVFNRLLKHRTSKNPD